MKITVFGSGYVGLITGACLADAGNHVVCIDINERRIEALNRGAVPMYEPGLDELVKANHGAGRLEFETDVAKGVAHGLFQFIAVGTPPDEGGSADMRYVLAVAESIGEHIDDYRVVVDKSTVPVGTAEKVRDTIARCLRERHVVVDFDVVSNPEFLKEGAAIEDFMKPDRIVVGTDNPRATELLRQLYAPFNRNHERFMSMDIRSAEFTKYAANAMLATKISFMNEMANVAELVGADIENVRIAIGADPRIGYHFIYPGCGYGGSCFPKDVRALNHTASRAGYDAHILSAVESVNDRQKHRLFEKIDAHYSGDLRDKTFAIWGLSFKPNTDDMREAPSRVLMETLWSRGAKVRAFDPQAGPEAERIYGKREDLTYCQDAEEALVDADALVLVTEWAQFRSPDFERAKELLRSPVVFDGRNVYDPEHLRSLGFTYHGIGRV